jgi:hypothetical protein
MSNLEHRTVGFSHRPNLTGILLAHQMPRSWHTQIANTTGYYDKYPSAKTKPQPNHPAITAVEINPHLPCRQHLPCPATAYDSNIQ